MRRVVEHHDFSVTNRRWFAGPFSFTLTDWGQKRGWSLGRNFKVVR